MKRRFSITINLNGDSPERECAAVAGWLRRHRAEAVTDGQWFILTTLTAEEVRKQLDGFLDPSDRIVVIQIGAVSARNLIGIESSEAGVA